MPTNVSMNCSWGDGHTDDNVEFPLVSPYFNASFKIFNATHTYAAANVYYQQCTMFNMVSQQTLSNNVSRATLFELLFAVTAFSSF